MITNKQIRNAYRNAFKQLLKDDVTEELLERSVYTPEDDNGGWAPRSKTIINFEYGLLESDDISFMCEANDLVNEALKTNGLFIESINNAVGAVYN